MTPDELLGLARGGDLDAFAAHRHEAAEAIRALVAAGDGASALELVARTFRAWLSRNELDEGSAVAALALAAPADVAPTWRARVLYADGLFAFRAGDRERSLQRNQEALALAAASGDLRGECEALTGLARVALRDGRYGDVVDLASRGREKARGGGDREAEAAPLHLLAAGVRLQEDHAAARELYLESLALNTELGNAAWIAMEHHNLGWVSLHLGDVEDAEKHFRERDARTSTDAYGDAWREINWAAVAASRGDAAEAERLLAAGEAVLAQAGSVPDPDDQMELDWLRDRIARLSR